MKKQEIIKAVNSGKQILVTRERVSIEGTTIPRKMFEDMLDSGKIVCVGRPNNFCRAYATALTRG